VRAASADNIEKADFLETRALREAIHAREGGVCFYCLRRLTPMVRCIDHVWRSSGEGAMATATWCPRARNVTRRRGSGEPRIFSAGSAARRGLSTGELRGRFQALAKLAAGKLRPPLEMEK